MNNQSIQPGPDELSDSLSACKAGLKLVLAFSFFINLLALAAPLYMLQVFDRVLGSGNTDTLLFLTLITLVAVLTLSSLEMVRSRIMVKLGVWLEQRLAKPVYSISIALASRSRGSSSTQGLRDVSTLRNFLTGAAVFPIMDAPWLPVYLGIIFMLHPMLGWIATGGAAVLLSLAIINNLVSRKPLQQSSAASISAMKQAEASVQNADVVMAMGLMENLNRRWNNTNGLALAFIADASNRSGLISAISKFVRQGLQVAIMGTGAWLVLGTEMSPGGMVAGSILLGRALAPVDQAIGSWKSALSARSAFARIKALFDAQELIKDRLDLPQPEGHLSIEKLVYCHASQNEPVLRGLSFRLEPGEVLGIIGPTASGKSTLAQLLVGTAKPDAGHVRIDGADISHWNSSGRGQFLGYLPQSVELFEGTVSENIARMGEYQPQDVVDAAKAANVHEVILALPEGYETNIGAGGAVLSGGQRQRIALARALYGKPSLVVLDEPNASLDLAGDSALLKSLQGLKKSSAATVIITHRASILSHADKVLVLYPGGNFEFGDRDQMLNKTTKPHSASAIKEVAHANS